MKKVIIAVLSVWLMFILQSSVFSRINIGGIVPNMLIIITACFGFMEGDLAGLLVGFFCGMLMDVFYGSFKGFYAMIYMYLGYLNGKFCNIFYPEDVKLPLALIVSTDLLYGLSCYVFLFLLRGRFEIGFYFGHIILPEIIMTIIMTLLVYPVILFVHKRFYEIKR
ncbi:MAG: rod shape-determining protein MreD [Lachnospiraceae bacterium]|jgi:rod shape-determining protein MreD|nr:rod shape-determining protein MreD [Lachnospiraceae bacterium]